MNKSIVLKLVAVLITIISVQLKYKTVCYASPKSISVRVAKLYQKRDYAKLVDIYDSYIKINADKAKVADVKMYYFSLIQIGQASRVPNPRLKYVNREEDIQKVIISATQHVDFSKETVDIKSIPVKFEKKDIKVLEQLHYFFDDYKNMRSVAAKIENDEVKIWKPTKVLDERKKTIVSVQTTKDGSELITYYYPKDRIFNIQIKGKNMPRFNNNSFFYSCAMPFYDEKNKVLYYCSDDIRGYGGWDIYYMKKLKRKKWSKPVLLGDNVNSVFDEIFPSTLDSLLFFSSNGRDGKGQFDIYYTGEQRKKLKNISAMNTSGDDYAFNWMPGNKKGIAISDSKLAVMDIYNFDGKVKKEAEIRIPETKAEPEPIIENPIATIEEKIEPEPLLKPKLVVAEQVEEPEVLKEDLSQVQSFDDSEDYFSLNKLYPLNDRELLFLTGETNYDYIFEPALTGILDTLRFLDAKGVTVFIKSGTDTTGYDRHNYNVAYERCNNIRNQLEKMDKDKMIRSYVYILEGENETDSPMLYKHRYTTFYYGYGNFPFGTLVRIKTNIFKDYLQLAGVYNHSLDELIKINSIFPKNDFSNMAYVGIKDIYRVKSGETIQDVSSIYNIDPKKIIIANKKREFMLAKNEFILIPFSD
ncbi:MAG: hypothetical protein N4A49_13100 [Marinifilaceae bacterium]|jgi:hypothetical protein|nr:hypothetical protein [Marinifilaceae bacterium]